MQQKKIKVLFFIDSFRVGGMHRQMLYLVKHLNREIFEPVMCTTGPKGGLRKEFEQAGCKLVDLGWTKRVEPAIIKRFVKILDSEKPDIIFITEPQNLVYYRLARLFWHEKVIQIGSFRALTFFFGHDKLYLRKIDNMFSRWLYRSSSHVVVNSVAMKENYAGIIKIRQTKPIEVIYNGSDFNFKITRPASEIRNELKLELNDILIIMVARLDPWKDFKTLFEAAKIVESKGKQAKFILTGDGVLRQSLETMISEMGIEKYVWLLGEKKDAFNYINAADISILSTNGEGFSNSVLESMALAKPVIATAVGGNVEVIGNNGKYGFLVPPKLSEPLAEAIITLIENPEMRKEIGHSAKERIYELCNIDNYISSYEELFLRSLNKKKESFENLPVNNSIPLNC